MQTGLNELSVRERSVGGDVIDVVRCRGLDPRNSERLLILIHGFNMTRQRAADALAGFHRRLSSGSARPLPDTWFFYWPGDHEDPRLSAVTYSVAVETAKTAGERLGQLLTELSPSQEVILVGHSLGCRVLLHALRYVAGAHARGTPSAQVVMACLMAAAVPEGRCQGLHQIYGSDVIKPAIHVMYSRNDCVLHRIFPLGQKLKGEVMGPAVGYLGGPPERWAEPRRETGLGHGDYLTAPESAATVAKMIDPTLPQTLAARKLPHERCLKKPRWLGQRKLPSRDLGERGPDSGWFNLWEEAGSPIGLMG